MTIGFAQSIDDFLDQHRTNHHVTQYGKAAIVKSVLEAERKSKLYYQPHTEETFDQTRFADTWFLKFIHMLGREVPRENVSQIFDHVSFIIFNYDRSVEYFLRNALSNLYSIHLDQAQSIVDDLAIIHPYGLIPAQTSFGATRANYIKLAADIKTYTEQIADADLKTQLTDQILRAECIVFLGFAYHAQNIRLLQPAEGMAAKRTYGTAYGMSNADRDLTAHQLAGFFSSDIPAVGRLALIQLDNSLTAAGLFDYYAKSLSGGD